MVYGRLVCWATIATIAVLCGGCAEAHRYTVKTDLPWPDEWAAGPRVPFDREVLLSSETVRWHRRVQMPRLARKIRMAVGRRADLYCFVRNMSAKREAAGRSGKGLAYLEVKIATRFFGPLKEPKRITAKYENRQFSQVIGELAGYIGRGYLLAPSVNSPAAVTADLKDIDPREALTRVLLDRNLFVEPIWYNPVILRSYEYPSSGKFLEAIKDLTAILSHPDPESPLSVVGLDQWARNNARYQLRFRAELKQARAAEHLGPLSDTELLSSDAEVVKKQILYTLAAQLGRDRQQPD